MRWHINLDYIFYLVIIIIVRFLTPEYNLFLKIITLDSLYSTIHFFKTFINKNIRENQILNLSTSLYKYTVIDRYIYYFCQFIIYKFICYYFWISNLNLLYYGILIFTIPSILNNTLINNIIRIIRRQKENIIKLVAAKQFALLIKLVAKIYLKKDINVKYREILPLLNNYKDTVNYSTEIIKNILIIILLSYLKNYSPNFYYRITKYFYAYKTGDILESYNTESAKTQLIDIINNKEWDNFLKPNIYQAIFYLYQINKEKNDFFRDCIFKFNYQLLKMFTLWTLSSFLNNIFIIPLVSLFIIIYRNNKITINFECIKNFICNILIIILGSCIGYKYHSYFLTSIICQFGYMTLMNPITKNIYKFITKKVIKKLIIFHHKNINNIIIAIINGIYVFIFSKIISSYTIILVTINIFYGIIIDNYKKKYILLGLLLINCIQSKYNMIHIAFCTTIMCYIVIVIDRKTINIVIKLIYNFYKNNKKKLEKNQKEKINNIKNNIIDYNIFDLPDNKFIEAISIESNKDKNLLIINVKNIEKTDIINNYLT